jgi:hypothetical protein
MALSLQPWLTTTPKSIGSNNRALGLEKVGAIIPEKLLEPS